MPRMTFCWLSAVAATTFSFCSVGFADDAIIAPASERFASKDVAETPKFQQHVVPLLSRLGCNGRACHGSFRGQGGFRLSLFGYDFKLDHDGLTKGDKEKNKEPRILVEEPEESLALLKATQEMPHRGGKRMDVDSWQYNIFRNWIKDGVKTVDEDAPKFVRLDVTPKEIQFGKNDEQSQLKVIAVWSDGTHEDVTPLCRFNSNDEVIAAIDANEGIEISEHLPKLVQNMHLFTILRGVTHTLAAHELGTEYVNAGSRPLPSLEYPGYSTIVVKELGANGNIPPSVAIPSSRQKTGYLGVQYAPLNTGATPKPGEMFSVRGLKLSGGLTIEAVEKRQALLGDLDRTFRGFEETNQLVKGLDKFGQQAHAMITSPKSRQAFDISKESPNFQKLFGDTPFDQSCLLASRLIEAGTRFVTIELGSWDTHQDNWTRLKSRNLPTLDSGLAGLLQGLDLKGMLETTTVFVTGEFGRTPKINTTRNGRDHYPRCMFMLMAGGGVKNGQVLGESNADATLPESKGFSPDDVAASLFHTLGISHTKEYHTDIGRPIMIVRDGHIIPELFA